MGIFSRIKGGISSKANAALDKAIDPAKELDMAILELEEGRKKALQELVTYKATAKTLDADMETHKAKAAEWEKRAMTAVKAGDDEAAKIAAGRSAGGDACGNDSSVWDKFKAAEERIDAEAIETEVDAAMRGEDMDALAFDSKLAAAAANPQLAPGPDDALSQLKAKMETDKAAKQMALASPTEPPKGDTK